LKEMRTISSNAFRSKGDKEPDDEEDDENEDEDERSGGGDSGGNGKGGGWGDGERGGEDDDNVNSSESTSGCGSGVVSSGSVADEELDDSVSLFSCAAFNCTPLVVAFRKSCGITVADQLPPRVRGPDRRCCIASNASLPNFRIGNFLLIKASMTARYPSLLSPSTHWVPSAVSIETCSGVRLLTWVQSALPSRAQLQVQHCRHGSLPIFFSFFFCSLSARIPEIIGSSQSF
jgi:hypothetical protein